MSDDSQKKPGKYWVAPHPLSGLPSFADAANLVGPNGEVVATGDAEHLRKLVGDRDALAARVAELQREMDEARRSLAEIVALFDEPATIGINELKLARVRGVVRVARGVLAAALTPATEGGDA